MYIFLYLVTQMSPIFKASENGGWIRAIFDSFNNKYAEKVQNNLDN